MQNFGVLENDMTFSLDQGQDSYNAAPKSLGEAPNPARACMFERRRQVRGKCAFFAE